MKKIYLYLISFVLLFSLLIYSAFHIKWAMLFSPGLLSKAHQSLDESGECSACHTRGKKLESDKCFTCHEEIKARIEAKSGFHARVSSDCAYCHSEHHGRSYQLIHLDKDHFDHKETGWPIEGRHALLKCEACHTRNHSQGHFQECYLLPSNECVQCHKDNHEGEYGTDCAECHTQNSFKVE